MDRDAVKKHIQAAMQDVYRHLEKREAQGLFTQKERYQSIEKFTRVAETITAYLDDPENAVQSDAEPGAIIAYSACRMEPDLLPYCRLLQYRIQRHIRDERSQ